MCIDKDRYDKCMACGHKNYGEQKARCPKCRSRRISRCVHETPEETLARENAEKLNKRTKP